MLADVPLPVTKDVLLARRALRIGWIAHTRGTVVLPTSLYFDKVKCRCPSTARLGLGVDACDFEAIRDKC